MPSLRDLPIELHQKIYALAVPVARIKVEVLTCTVYPEGRSPESAARVRDWGEQEPTPSPNKYTALALVDRQVSAAALPILYARHSFEFRSSRALEMFLDQIGANKQHLRHVGIAMGGYEHDAGSIYSATKRSFAMLASAAGLQSLSVSHFDFCCSEYSRRPEFNFENFVYHCSQLSQVLKVSREINGLKTDLASMLSIFKIMLPECAGCHACSKRGPQYMSRNRTVGGKNQQKTKRCRCRCKCIEAERNNEKLLEQLKRRFALELGLE